MSIIQDWAAGLGLRHQGVLVSAVRGCDGLPREDPSKWLVRFYRSCLLHAHVGDPAKAASYMVWPDSVDEACKRRGLFLAHGFDHYPMHWLTHFMFAAEITGYYYQEPDWIRLFWYDTYHQIVRRLHLNPESKDELDCRLNRDEKAFRKAQEPRDYLNETEHQGYKRDRDEALRHHSMENAPGESSFAEDRPGTFNEVLKKV